MVLVMTTSTTITTADDIGALLDEAAHALSALPGRRPQDVQIASTLLAYTMSGLYGHGSASRLLLNTLERRGVDACEAQLVAQALHGLALRLGAWLGRAER
jgi:hypothetical protein